MGATYIPGDDIPLWLAIPLIIISWTILLVMILRDRKRMQKIEQSFWIQKNDGWENLNGDWIENKGDLQDVFADLSVALSESKRKNL